MKLVAEIQTKSEIALQMEITADAEQVSKALEERVSRRPHVRLQHEPQPARCNRSKAPARRPALCFPQVPRPRRRSSERAYPPQELTLQQVLKANTAALNAVRSIHVTIEVSSNYPVSGDECPTEAQPTWTYEWYKDGVRERVRQNLLRLLSRSPLKLLYCS
jgi:hypothetical protein